MQNTRPKPGAMIPGYTGHQSAQIGEEREAAQIQELTMRQQEANANNQFRVPGYQGYVPQLKSENVFGGTFGKTTNQQQMGQVKAGFDCSNEDRYHSQARDVFTGQMQQKVFGTSLNPNGPSKGNVTMDFETARKAAQVRQQE